MASSKVWKKVYESDLSNIVKEVKEFLDTPAVVILSGEVGAGKTTLTKQFVPEAQGQVTSPSYSIVNEVDDVCHADFYRLKSNEDIEHLELELYLDDKEYFLVEWGRPYLSTLQRQLGSDFSYYELKIETNDNLSDSNMEPSRNYYLEALEF